MTGSYDHPWLGAYLGDREAAEIWSADRQLAHMLAFEAAFTRALGSTGVIDPAMAAEIAIEIEQFTVNLPDLRRGTATDGVPVPALVKQLRQSIGKDAKAIHTGATSQDVIDTALALTLRDFNDLLSRRISATIDAIERHSRNSGNRPLMGRTRMQAALPITVADRLITWSQPLARHLEHLEQLRPSVECLQLGGAVGDRAALAPNGDAIAADMAARLGLKNTAKATHVMRDHIANYAGLLSQITGGLGKIGQDICLMAQQGIDEITLAGGGGSSAMPHKQNPVLAELLVSNARFNATQLSGMHHALIHEQERSAAAWVLEWMILPQMAQTTARSLSAAAELCAEITAIGSKSA